MVAAFGEPGDLSNPAQVALCWWTALLDDADEVVRSLTYHPPAWGTFQWTRDLLQGRSLASRVIPLVDAPDDVAVMRFVDQAQGQAFASFCFP